MLKNLEYPKLYFFATEPVLVRYLTQDDSDQATLVEKLISKYTNQAESIFINNIVLCELVWVLSRGYKYKKQEIVLVLRQMLSTLEFKFESPHILWEALEEYEQAGLDFSDSLISKTNRFYGCLQTFTFDVSAAKSEGIKLVD